MSTFRFHRSFRLSANHLLALCLALLLITAQAAGAQDPAQAVSSSPVDRQSAEAITEYWTPERLAGAKPMPMPTLDPASKARESGQTEASAPGPITGLVGSSGLPGDLPLEEEVSFSELDAPTEFGTYPFSYTRFQLYPISMYKRLQPHMAVGKLYFTIPGQGNFVCSGASINSANRAVIWTAGHCVYSPGIGYHTNVLFAPGHANGNHHNGTFAAYQLSTLTGWANSGLFEWDMGAIVAHRGGLGSPGLLGDKVGFLGFMFNAPRGQHFHAVGYPAAPRDLNTTPPGPQFDGARQQICAAAWAVNDDPPGGSGDPNTIGIGCDNTGGASGGPWIVDRSKFGGSTNFITGVNSYKYGGGPPFSLRMYSPYHGDGAVNLRDAVQGATVP
ncbi:MAG: hypothetical protein SX243_12825 [Acidobacteriota bacterium]|nr:hypothetical protein [Acidobacteriota bacterium]